MKTDYVKWIIIIIIAIVILGGSVFSVMNYFKKPEQPADNYERIKILLAEELSKIKLDSAVVQNIYYIKQQEEKQKQQIANMDSIQVDSVLMFRWQNWKQTKEGWIVE